jgi:hypothetical protein
MFCSLSPLCLFSDPLFPVVKNKASKKVREAKQDKMDKMDKLEFAKKQLADALGEGSEHPEDKELRESGIVKSVHLWVKELVTKMIFRKCG